MMRVMESRGGMIYGICLIDAHSRLCGKGDTRREAVRREEEREAEVLIRWR